MGYMSKSADTVITYKYYEVALNNDLYEGGRYDKVFQNDFAHYIFDGDEETPLLEYLYKTIKGSRSKIKATLIR